MTEELETRTQHLGETQPAPPVIAGDHSDDDAIYMDRLFEEDPEPPDPSDLPVAHNTLPAATIERKHNRLRCRSGMYSNGCAPIMVLPEDPYRTSLGITSVTSNCYLADNAQVLQSTVGVGMTFLIPAGTTFLLGDYTGPVYLAPLGDGLSTWTYSVIGISE